MVLGATPEEGAFKVGFNHGLSGEPLGEMWVTKTKFLQEVNPALVSAMGGGLIQAQLVRGTETKLFDLPHSKPFAHASPGDVYQVFARPLRDVVRIDCHDRSPRTKNYTFRDYMTGDWMAELELKENTTLSHILLILGRQEGCVLNVEGMSYDLPDQQPLALASGSEVRVVAAPQPTALRSE